MSDDTNEIEQEQPVDRSDHGSDSEGLRPDASDDTPDPSAGRPGDAHSASSVDDDPGRYIRTWFWMVLVAGFGLFLVFGSVQAHYWRRNVYVERGTDVLDVWRAQVNGLPDVAHQTILKSVFLVSVFGFIGLAVVALWLASVEVRPDSPARPPDAAGMDDSAQRQSHAAG